jgi:hypothetical protein
MDLEPLLVAFSGAANEPRRAAEAALNELRATPDVLLLGFVNVRAPPAALACPARAGVNGWCPRTGAAQALRGSASALVRSTATVLFRRVCSQEEASMFVLCSPGAQDVIKRSLLEAVGAEPEPSVRRLLCDTIAELGLVILDEGMWPELMPFLHSSISSESPAAFECGLLMFEYLSACVNAAAPRSCG